jgi:hypothetical protein
MSEILTHGRSNNTCFGFKPGDTGMKTVNLKANKSSDSQANMVALRDFQAALRPFDSRNLFETPMRERSPR